VVVAAQQPKNRCAVVVVTLFRTTRGQTAAVVIEETSFLKFLASRMSASPPPLQGGLHRELDLR
jgi:hypothetical protein